MVKKTTIAVTFIGLGAVAGCFLAAFQYWRQATQLPTWYTHSSTAISVATNPADPAVAAAGIKLAEQLVATGSQADQTSTKPQVEARLNADELNQLVVAAIAENPKHSPLLGSARALNTTIEDGRIASGIVVDLSTIPTQKLEARQKAALERATALFPNLANREIYLGIEGQPRVENGQLQLDDSTVIKVGALSLTTQQLIDQLGISKAQLERGLNQQLQLKNLSLEELELVGDSARVKGLIQ
ncbi:hypothetical protein [Leptolyngbya sp. FACHB-261]|uniref:hypothetical protein n=1 Tax=Leptolyngbya sp. FACHB-261 TaxID=2692806 RepID=UPI00168797A4|nr:hypothetical protein [Leptolyngbya sp. FACHB-261]MBD2103665.1 hypothetical protein [Leptolyngbya sp. FACHB-261]